MRKVYFIGIGGIGMSALAQYLKDRGDSVEGSDREASPVTAMLEEKGIGVKIGQRAENVPEGAALVIYSDAVPEENPERARAKELGIPQLSYFAMLGEVSAGMRTVAVAGTHGKTTTTGMLAAILKAAGAAPTAIIGSIVRDFSSNYLPGAGELFVVEACEYRDHLLELSPEILVITNLEWDHTDWFSSLEALSQTFAKAMRKVPERGAILTDPSHPNIAPLLEGLAVKVIDYTKEPAFELKLPGEFNQMNARAAAAAARVALPGITTEAIADALANFHGTWRRFEYKGKTARGVEVYDDYAHHPTAIKETLRALRAKTRGKVYVAFHPHLYSRTRDLLDGFARAFGDADEVLVAPIYAAREADDGSISSEVLAEHIRAEGVRARAASFEEIERALSVEPQEGDAIISMGAGDIYKVADALIKH
ncbi:MAG TPA: Mur ligase domain-containing protein [Candidatus Paceibacterota bacterium]|nr:Mur ligase domain-containing protein [Candidatus Paceibacterota bacterium]